MWNHIFERKKKILNRESRSEIVVAGLAPVQMEYPQLPPAEKVRISTLQIDVTSSMNGINASNSPWIAPMPPVLFDEQASLYPLKRLDALGRGSSAVVYRAVYLKTLTVCAEKVIVASDPNKRLLLMRELESLKKSVRKGQESCPNIVKLLDVVSNPTDGTLSMCLEYMNGGSLQDIVDNGGCKDEVVLRRIAKQMLNGLNFLHDLRIIHRDLKPSNALISSKGIVKLADFGLARTLDIGNTLADSFVGTFDYMAPERMTGQQYSFASDIWAFGITIHTTAIGRYPYKLNGGGFWPLLNAIQESPVPLPPDSLFSTEFIAFVGSACEKEPSNRINAAQLLYSDFILNSKSKKNNKDSDDDADEWQDDDPFTDKTLEQVLDEALNSNIDVTKLIVKNKPKKTKKSKEHEDGGTGNDDVDVGNYDNDANDTKEKPNEISEKSDDKATKLPVIPLPYNRNKIDTKVPSRGRAKFIEENKRLIRPRAPPEAVKARNKGSNKAPTSNPPVTLPVDANNAVASESKVVNGTISLNAEDEENISKIATKIELYKKYIIPDSTLYKTVQKMSCMTAEDANDLANLWKNYIIKQLALLVPCDSNAENATESAAYLNNIVADVNKSRSPVPSATIPKINLSITKLDRLGRDLGCSSTLLRTAFHRVVVEIKDAVLLAIGLGGMKVGEVGEKEHIQATKKLKDQIRIDEHEERQNQLDAASSDEDENENNKSVSDNSDDESDDLGIGKIDDDYNELDNAMIVEDSDEDEDD